MKTLLNKLVFTRCKFKQLYSTGPWLGGKTKEVENKPPPVRSKKILDYFEKNNHLKEVIKDVPPKYFTLKRRLKLNNLYLADQTIAESVVKHLMPSLVNNKEQVVCETNAGLGLITKELLKNGIEVVRMYETCGEFRNGLKGLNEIYPNRVELFIRNIFHLGFLSKMDNIHTGDRVEQLLKDVPAKNWSDDPIMTIIGPMANLTFIDYLIRMLTTQQEIIKLGRPQIFAIMKPMDFIKCTAKPGMSLHTYQRMSVLFQILFDYELLDKYPRKSFLPWETKFSDNPRVQYHSRYDTDFMYLVKINLKRELPVQNEYLLHLHYFVKQCMYKRKAKVILTLENWLPGIGINLIVPRQADVDNYFQNMNIYTEFGELSAIQILHVFLEMIEHPDYHISAFVDLLSMKKKESVDGDLMEYDEK